MSSHNPPNNPFDVDTDEWKVFEKMYTMLFFGLTSSLESSGGSKGLMHLTSGRHATHIIKNLTILYLKQNKTIQKKMGED
mgnify:CR=1 FL=1|tara:strand:+ start:52 stop:291 length:240 start_codon:yes stop_codon:yes gene_type:complete